jgi:hypothetical protein
MHATVADSWRCDADGDPVPVLVHDLNLSLNLDLGRDVHPDVGVDHGPGGIPCP